MPDRRPFGKHYVFTLAQILTFPRAGWRLRQRRDKDSAPQALNFLTALDPRPAPAYEALNGKGDCP